MIDYCVEWPSDEEFQKWLMDLGPGIYPSPQATFKWLRANTKLRSVDEVRAKDLDRCTELLDESLERMERIIDLEAHNKVLREAAQELLDAIDSTTTQLENGCNVTDVLGAQCRAEDNLRAALKECGGCSVKKNPAAQLAEYRKLLPYGGYCNNPECRTISVTGSTEPRCHCGWEWSETPTEKSLDFLKRKEPGVG